MVSTTGAKRLSSEYKALLKQKTENFVARPDTDDVFLWHYCIFGLKDCDYEGGYYYGTLTFPETFPQKPPSIRMSTPSGRFKTDYRLCLSISDYHPESWSPLWGVENIMIGLISFMCDTDSSSAHSIGGLRESSDIKKQKATESLNYNLTR
mmetsp:Transcript_518/g.309  ORF Transcript_518/g.309 Transcript_518/m.309 type:complete len:151 (+) Transcript_518:30-482(+)